MTVEEGSLKDEAIHLIVPKSPSKPFRDRMNTAMNYLIRLTATSCSSSKMLEENSDIAVCNS